MTYYHYTYRLARISGPMKGPRHYIGVRSSKRTPDTDPYMGSSDIINRLIASGVEFAKEVLSTHESREDAAAQEIVLIEKANAVRSAEYYNLRLPVKAHTTFGLRKYADPQSGAEYLTSVEKGEALGFERVWPSKVVKAEAPPQPIDPDTREGQIIKLMCRPDGVSEEELYALDGRQEEYAIKIECERLYILMSELLDQAGIPEYLKCYDEEDEEEVLEFWEFLDGHGLTADYEGLLRDSDEAESKRSDLISKEIQKNPTELAQDYVGKLWMQLGYDLRVTEHGDRGRCWSVDNPDAIIWKQSP